jgi:pseudaminic acid cytidylyltransferase
MAERSARSTLGVIPARGGSKRIPRKNIRPFLGVPLLARTVEMLIGTQLFDRLVVSTDDEEIARIAREAGAETPFVRPAELASDVAGTAPVIAHAISEVEARGYRAEYVCCIYPAAVLARGADLKRAAELLRSSDADFVFPAASFAHPIQRALRKTASDRCEMFWPEQGVKRSQDLEPAFHDAGQFYFGRRSAWLAQRPILGPGSIMIELPHYRVQDIDTPEDWKRAEMLVRLLEQDGRG